jgi:hypothetical protein
MGRPKKPLHFHIGQMLVCWPNGKLKNFHLVKVTDYHSNTHYDVMVLKGYGHKPGKIVAWTRQFVEENFFTCDSEEQAALIEEMAKVLFA